MPVGIIYNHKEKRKTRAINVPSPEPRYHINKRTKPRRKSIKKKPTNKKQTLKRRKPLQLLARALSSLGSLLGKKVCNIISATARETGRCIQLTLVDVWKNTTLGDSDVTQKLVQLLIVTDGELEVTRDDTGLLVVTGSVACQFKDFGSEVFKDGSEVNRSTYSMLVLWNMEIGRKKKANDLPAPTRWA